MFGSSVNCLFCVVVYGFSGVFCLKKKNCFSWIVPAKRKLAGVIFPKISVCLCGILW